MPATTPYPGSTPLPTPEEIGATRMPPEDAPPPDHADQGGTGHDHDGEHDETQKGVEVLEGRVSTDGDEDRRPGDEGHDGECDQLDPDHVDAGPPRPRPFVCQPPAWRNPESLSCAAGSRPPPPGRGRPGAGCRSSGKSCPIRCRGPCRTAARRDGVSPPAPPSRMLFDDRLHPGRERRHRPRRASAAHPQAVPITTPPRPPPARPRSARWGTDAPVGKDAQMTDTPRRWLKQAESARAPSTTTAAASPTWIMLV